MPYVSRDESGNITGLYANPQPGFAEEYLPDDDPEVVAFQEANNPAERPPTQAATDVVLLDHENRLRAIEGQPPLTIEQFRARL